MLKLKNILLGHNEFGQEVVLDTEKFLKQRLLFQGISGSWKTETIKTIIKGLKEVTKSDQNPNGIQQIIFDWEGEYHPLRKSFPYLLIGDEGEFPADVEIAEDLAIEVRKTGTSVIVDLSSFKDYEERQEFVGIFIRSILDVGKQYWKPCNVFIDEAHNLCRQGESRSASKKPIIQLCETGRKRGISTILVTQRLSALDKNASAQMVNRLIGLTIEVPDREAAAKLLGGGIEMSNAIKDFKGGEFFAFGSAIAEREVQRFKVDEVREFEKPDLLNVSPLNRHGEQIVEEIADRINYHSDRSQSLQVHPEISNENEKFIDDEELHKLIRDMDKPDPRADPESFAIPNEGKVSLTQSQIRKMKLESWNNAFEYFLQASQVRRGIFRRKLKLLDIIRVKTKHGDEKYIINGFEQICKKCGTMLEGTERVVCQKCIQVYTENRK